MKKAFLFLLPVLSIASTSIFAQDLTKAQLYAATKKYDEAKKEIDQITATEKGAKSAEAVYLKAQIYTAILFDSTLKNKYPTARQTALETLKTYLTLDQKYKMLQDDNYGVISNLYAAHFNDGAAEYNQKKYSEAANSFKQAVWISDKMIENKWGKAAMDTSAILYAGISAQNAQKDDDAVAMYTRLIDKQIVSTGYQGIYEFVVDYYYKKKDDQNFQKYLAVGKKMYPEDKFWLAIEMESVRDKGDFTAVVTTYETMANKQPSYDLYIELGHAIYDYLYPKDTTKVPQNKEMFEQKMIDAYNKAATLKTDEGVPYFSIAGHYYNKAVSFNKQYNIIRTSKKPEDIKKKDELLKQSNSYVDQAIAAYEKACERFAIKTKPTTTDKFCYKNSVSSLINLYEEKMKNYKPNTPDYKKYDDLHKKALTKYDELDKLKY